MINLMQIDTIFNTTKGRCVLLSSETPENLEITGADVNGLPNDYILATGSLLITPEANYLAFSDGEFTKLGAE